PASRAVAKRPLGVGDQEWFRRLVHGRDAGGTGVLPPLAAGYDFGARNAVSLTPKIAGRCGSGPHRRTLECGGATRPRMSHRGAVRTAGSLGADAGAGSRTVSSR